MVFLSNIPFIISIENQLNGTRQQAEARLTDIVTQVATGVYIEDIGITVVEYRAYRDSNYGGVNFEK